MKKSIKVYIIYFPITLVFLQVLINFLALIDFDFYNKVGFYLNTFFGTNILFALFLVGFTFFFKFCSVSRAASIAELLFGINYLIIQNDNLYNILFQIIVGTIALIICLRSFIHKFPNCNVSLVRKFWSKFWHTGSCEKALDLFEEDRRKNFLKNNYGK
jgi:hypothetical protein